MGSGGGGNHRRRDAPAHGAGRSRGGLFGNPSDRAHGRGGILRCPALDGRATASRGGGRRRPSRGGQGGPRGPSRPPGGNEGRRGPGWAKGHPGGPASCGGGLWNFLHRVGGGEATGWGGSHRRRPSPPTRRWRPTADPVQFEYGGNSAAAAPGGRRSVRIGGNTDSGRVLPGPRPAARS